MSSDVKDQMSVGTRTSRCYGLDQVSQESAASIFSVGYVVNKLPDYTAFR
jgi:hypothetical protein